MDYLITLKLFSLVFAICYTQVNLIKGVCRSESISYKNFVIQSLSISIFVALQFNLFN